jgi:hypothetical protein
MSTVELVNRGISPGAKKACVETEVSAKNVAQLNFIIIVFDLYPNERQ